MSYLWKRDGIWYMRYKDRAGRWVKRSTGMRLKETAQGKLDEAERQVTFGEPKSLAAFLDEYLNRKPSARYAFCRDVLTHAHSPLAGLMLEAVNVKAVVNYIGWRLGHGRQRGTVAKEVAWLKAAMDAAAEEGYVSWERTYQLRHSRQLKFKGTPPRERILLPHEQEILFDAIRHNENLHAALTLAFWTGLRKDNILHLVEGQVDFTCDPAVIRFTPQQMKGKHGHLVLLTPAMKDLLWQRWQGSPSRRFFYDFNPTWKRLQAKLEREGKLIDFNFHDLRRTYGTYRIAAGVDPKTVQDELAHKTIKMTMDVYTKALKDPAVRAWAMRHFRFPWDPQITAGTYVGHAADEMGEKPAEPGVARG